MKFFAMRTNGGSFIRNVFRMMGITIALMLSAAGAWSATVEPLDDWYDPELPAFLSDIIVDPGRTRIYAADQITGQVFRYGIADSTVAQFEGFGFVPSRDDILTLACDPGTWDALKEGEIRVEWDGGRLFVFDGRKQFGIERWFSIDPSSDTSVFTRADAPRPATPRVLDQALLADAVAELAGQGKRVRPWRWCLREALFQMIDRQGRGFVFSVEPGMFGRKKLRIIFEIDSLYSRLTEHRQADIHMENGILKVKIGTRRLTGGVEDDPYTGERMIRLDSDTTPPPAFKPSAARKPKINLPPFWGEFLRHPRVLAEGPAGQLLSAKMRLTQMGLRTFLVLTRDASVKMLLWNAGQEPEPEDVVVMPEGFAVMAPPGWQLAGWTPDFEGILPLGNSRFQRIAPIVSTRGVSGAGGDTFGVTNGLYVLDAEKSSITELSMIEWPHQAAPTELQIKADPLDLTVTRDGDVYLLARSDDRSVRMFKYDDAPHPVVVLPENARPVFIPGPAPTITQPLVTPKTQEAKRQAVLILVGQPPMLVRKEVHEIEWHTGQGISWRYEEGGMIQFSTDPTGESDTAMTVEIESGGRVMQAVALQDDIWLLEMSDSGIAKLDVTEPMDPQVTILDENGFGLRSSMGLAMYTTQSAGTADVIQMTSNGRKRSLGRFPDNWMALGADRTRIFMRDRRTSAIQIVPNMQRTGRPDEDGQVSGRVDFNYDDPSNVFVCAVAQQAFCMIVRPQAPTFLLGPMPAGAYRVDVSSGLFDLAGPFFFQLSDPDLELSDVRLNKTMDFMSRRAVFFEEAQNREMARYNYEMYLSFNPDGADTSAARSAIVDLYASEERWDEMIEYFRKAPPGTNWSARALRRVFERLPKLTDRLEIGRRMLDAAPKPDIHTASLLFFMYRHTSDPSYRTAVRAAGLPVVYSRFFESIPPASP